MNFKNLIALALALVIASPTFAATSKKKKTTVKTEAPAAPAATPAAPVENSTSSSKGWTPSASFGIGSIGSEFHLGVLGKFETSVDFQGTSFKAGAKTGFLLGTGTASDFIIPVMGTATYTIPNGGALNPYIGLDLGISIYHYSITTPFINTSVSDTLIKFAALITPGIHINPTLYAELPFGSMAGGFIILPSVGMHF